MPVDVHSALIFFQCELIEMITATLLKKTGQIRNSKIVIATLRVIFPLFSAILQCFFPFILNHDTGFNRLLRFYTGSVLVPSGLLLALWKGTGHFTLHGLQLLGFALLVIGWITNLDCSVAARICK